MKKKEELMALIKEADEITKEKLQRKEKLELIQKQADNEQENFKKEYGKLVQQFQQEDDLFDETYDQYSLSNDSQETSPEFNTFEGSSAKVVIIRPDQNNSPRNQGPPIKIENDVKQEPSDMTEENELEMYEQFFEKLYYETQLNSVDEIISTYENIDSINDNLFNEIKRVNDEVEVLSKEVKIKNEEINSLLKPLTAEEKTKLQQIEKLQLSITQNEKKIEVFEEKIDGLNSNISSFSRNLPEIMKLLGMEVPENLSFNERNLGLLKEYLGEIEKRICSVVELHKIIEHQKVDL